MQKMYTRKGQSSKNVGEWVEKESLKGRIALLGYAN